MALGHLAWHGSHRRLLASVLAAGGFLLAAAPARAEGDTFETFNRAMFKFNNAVVDNLVDPMANLGEAWLPPSVRQAGRNMYANLAEPEFIVTNLLYGRLNDAGNATERFAINSTLGIAGVFDPATAMGLDRRETEFGEAVCTAGIPPGPYLVLPLAGPANATSVVALGGLVAAEWYVLRLVSTWLVAADAVVDASIAAATLRHAADKINGVAVDPYVVQRTEYLDYLARGCGAAAAVKGAG